MPLTPEEEDAIIKGYWSGPSYAAPAPAPAPPAPPPVAPAPPPPAYQPNPGAPGYNPNPGATSLAPPPPRNQVLGALPGAPPPDPNAPNPHPIFQNPFNQTAIDMGEVDAPAPNIPPPVPSGPSPDDDAALAALRAKQDATPEKKIASYWGATGGAPSKANPDPYGINAALQGRVDAVGHQMDAMGRARDADAVRATQIAEGQRDFARMQQEDAAIDRAEADLAQRHYDEGMQEIARQVDDVRNQKVDPFRMMKEHPALGVAAVIGGALSGFYQGLTGGQSNQFLDDLDRQLDRSTAADEKELANKKFALGQMQNLIGMQREVQKDENIARLQSRNMQYEAVKQDIAAKAEEDGVPVSKARADEAIAQVEQAQKALMLEIAAMKQKQAAAAGAAGVAQAKEVQKVLLETYKEHLAKGFSPEQSMQAARSIVDTLYLGGGHVRLPKQDMSGLGPSGREEIAKENYRTTQEATGILNSIRSFDPVKVSAGGVYGEHAPNALMTEGQKADRDERERYNALVRPAVGAAWRLQTHSPEPRNVELLDEQAKSFIIKPTDNEKDAARKKANLEQHMINAAKSGGIELPDVRSSGKISAELGAKPIK